MAFNWFFWRKKDKVAVDTPEETPIDTTSEPIPTDPEAVASAADESIVTDQPTDSTTEETPIVVASTPSEDTPSEPIDISERPTEESSDDSTDVAPAPVADGPDDDGPDDGDPDDESDDEESADEETEEITPVAEESVTDDVPVAEDVQTERDSTPVVETVSDQPVAEPTETVAEVAEDSTPTDSAEEAVTEPVSESTEDPTPTEESVSAEDILAEGALDDGIVTPIVIPDPSAEVPTETPTESTETPAESTETPAETTETPAGEDGGFVMDEETLRAFMEEGEIDDFIYAGSTYEERQETLERIADSAETLAEEGTEFLEQEQREREQAEPRYNENGELIDENGRVVLKRSFENKLLLAGTRERRYYNRIKNEILSYAGIKAEIQTMSEVFRHGKQVVARLSIAGFTRIYFALNPEEFDVDRYKQADQTNADFEDTRMLLRVRDDDEFAVVSELLAIMMGSLGIDRLPTPSNEDFLQTFPRREDAVLDKKGKMLSFEEKDEKALERERRAEERRAAGISEEVEEEPQEEEVHEEPLIVLPLNLENKLHQTTNTIKLLYSKLKNELLSYKTLKSEMNVKNENFRAGKKIIARMTVVADSVRLYLALDPKEFSTRKFKHKDASDQQGYEGTTLMMKISGEKDRLLAVQLIGELMKKLSLERNKRYAYVPFAEKYPYIKNGVFAGEENKPRVKHEGEEYTDIYGELTEHLRSQMGVTDAWGVPRGYTAEDGLTARDLLEMQRSKAKTINAGVALATPIVFFYDAAIDEAGTVQYLNVQQVLNDKFLGKMLPQEYFAIAESSTRIEELNFIALDTVVKDCNEHPELRFVVKISCRLLLKQETLTKLVDKMRTEHQNLILAFDCAMLEAVGFVGISAINTLKSQGALIMIDNAESASMRVLTEYDFDYLRLDARYYDGESTKRLAHLDMITGYAAVQNIITTSINCEHKEEARILLDHGVKIIQGDAVARPMRLINLALTNVKPIPKVKRHGEN